MKIISILNQKGGVGKTTTTINLSAGLGLKGYKILIIDIDPQANATMSFNISKDEIEADVFSTFILKITSLKEAIKETYIKNVDIITANINLVASESVLKKLDEDYKIFKPLEDLADNYDYIIFDCPPVLNILNKNALIISDSVLIPMQSEYFAFEGLTQLLSTISIIKRSQNRKLKVEGILITMHLSNTIFNNEIQKEVKKYFPEKLYKTVIPRNIKLAEAPSVGKTIFDYDASSKGAIKYWEFVEEFLNKQND